MHSENLPSALSHALQRDNYAISSLDDEVRADSLCKILLKEFHRHLLEERGLAPLDAGSLAAGADYFLRDFMISNQQANIFSTSATSIRRFAGYWYIISNLEPNMVELSSLLSGTAAFFHFCVGRELMQHQQVAQIATACQDLPSYQLRIESFNAITGDGYSAWEQGAV